MKTPESEDKPESLGEILIGSPELEKEIKELNELPLPERIPKYIERAKTNQEVISKIYYEINQQIPATSQEIKK